MAETRIIKKYPNRRLYDTAISSYITLEDVKRLVLEDISIQVIDARSKSDITHNTLLQIILEQEETGPPIFTTEILQQMIRFYGGPMQNVIIRTFEQTTQFFSEYQNAVKQGVTDGMQEVMQRDVFSLMSDSTKKDTQAWQNIQDQWVKALQNQQADEQTQEVPADDVSFSAPFPESTSS